MRIAFDGTTLQPRRTGVGYYSEHLLRHLVAADPGGVVVLSNRQPDLDPWPTGLQTMVAGQRMVRVAWMQTIAPRLLAHAGADLAHFTNGMVPLASPIPTVVTIHDMSLVLHADTHPARRRWLNRPLMKLASERASAIITVSESARRDILRMYQVDPSKVHVVHEAAAPIFGPVTDPARRAEVRRTHALPDRFLLCVGAIEPRKNLPRLLEAFAARRIPDRLPPLVCVGPYGWRSRDLGRRIEALGIQGAVHFTGYVPQADLPVIYSLAELFVFPSIYEGFGLPVLEAMACGTPTIVGHHDALTEVAGDAAVVVDPMDVASIGDALVALASDGERRRALSEAGRGRAAAFSWVRAADETRRVYAAALAQPAPARLVPEIGPASGPAPVLIGQAYYLRFDPKLWEAQQPYAPLGALYAAAALRADGVPVAFFDAMLAGSEEEWAASLDAHRPSLAVIFEDNFNYLTKMCLLRMRVAATRMIAMASARGIPVVVAGSDATDHPEVYLAAGALAVIVGEGEATLVELAAALRDRRPWYGIAGVCWRDAEGGVRRSGARQPQRDLDHLPRPAWDLVDLPDYRARWRARHGHFSMPVSTTRGCPYHCNWCAKPLYGQRYAVRSPEGVADEFAWLRRTHAPDHIWITDDIFGLTPGWIEAFATAVDARGAAVPFKCLMRADQVDASVVRSLRRARCRTVWLGAESGSQRVLDAMDKGLTVAQIENAAGLLHAADIGVGFFLQFGYPGETASDIARTIAMVRRCRPDDIGISVSYPLPGTPFYERVRADLGDRQNWVDSADLSPMYRAPFSVEFYRVLHRAVHAEFRLLRASSLRGAWRRPWTLRSGDVRLAASAIKHAGLLPALRWRLARLSHGQVW